MPCCRSTLIMRRRDSFVFLVSVFFATALGASAETLWQIGVFNDSSAEFSGHLDPVTGKSTADYTDPSKDPAFIVGRSNYVKDWLPYQPGTINGRAGYRRHPFTVQFDLTEPPAGVYTLRLALLAYSPRLPWLEVEINGHRGWFYQHPKLAYTGGDQSVFYLPDYSTAQVACELPMRFLVKGTNKLVLTALDAPAQRDDTQPSGFTWPGTSGIVYDALSLEHDAQARESAAVTALLQPSIYYKRGGSGLVELADMYVRLGRRFSSARATLVLGDRKFSQNLTSDRDFGEQRLEFEIPETVSAGNGEIVIEQEGHTHHVPVLWRLAKKWTILVAPNVHLDVGYSDYDSKVAEIHSRTVDEAISMIDGNPEFRFNLDGSWVVEQFMKGRSEEQRSRFVELVKEKKILIPAVYASNFTGFQTIESLIRSFYFSKNFAQHHQTEFNFSLINDVPSYSWSYASAMAAAGLKFFVAASDAYRAPFLLYNRFNEISPQWWEGPDGGRVLTWYSRHYHQMASLFGLPPQVAVGHDSLPRFLQAYDRPGYKADAVLLFGTQVENTDLFPQQASLVAEWNRVYAYPKLEYAGLPEAMSRIVAQMGDAIPVVRGDGGPYWEDGMIADARLTAVARESEQRILSAEKFATISSLVNPVARPDRGVLERAWRNLLLTAEHSWQADRSVTDPESEQSIRQGAVKDARGDEAQRQIDFSLGRSLAAIVDYTDNPKGTLVVFNPLNWTRSELVEADIDRSLAPVDLVTGQVAKFEVLSTGRSYRRVRFLAQDVPPLGYKSFALKPAPPGDVLAVAANRTIIENTYYRVTLDPQAGAVRGIFDKELARELIDAASPFRFGQYLYVTGAGELPNRLVQFSSVSPIPKLEIHPSGGGRLLSVARTPFGTVARLESSGLNTPRVETEIVLRDDQKKIAFNNRIRKTKVYTKEAAYFAFPLAMDTPQFRHETQNGYVNPARDLLHGAGLEWFNVQHWVAAEQGNLAATIVPVDAPMVTLGDIARGVWPDTFSRRHGTIFSYVMSNYTPEGYPAGQGGDLVFRYVLTSARRFDPVEAGHLGWAAMSPFETDEISPNDKAIFVPRPLAASHGSFLEIDQPDVTLVTWKLAEDGKGSILRFLETGGRQATVTVHSPLLDITSAWACNAVEDNQRPLEISSQGLRFAMQPFAITTVRIEGKRLLGRP